MHDFAHIRKLVEAKAYVAIDTEYDPGPSIFWRNAKSHIEAPLPVDVVGWSLATSKTGAWYFDRRDADWPQAQQLLAWLTTGYQGKIWCWNIQAELKALRVLGHRLKWPQGLDAMMLPWMMQCKPYGLKARAKLDLGASWATYDEMVAGRHILDVPPEELRQYAANDARYTLLLAKHWVKRLRAETDEQHGDLWEVCKKQSLWIPYIAHRMEMNGLPVDVEGLESIKPQLLAESTRAGLVVEELTKRTIVEEVTIRDAYCPLIKPKRKGEWYGRGKPRSLTVTVPVERGCDPSKPLEVARWGYELTGLWKRTGVPKATYGKTELPSVKSDWLEVHIARGGDGARLAQAVLDYRAGPKIVSTYVEPLVALGRSLGGTFHPAYNPTGTVSGRFSCVAAWTPVRTFRGDVPMAQVRVGDHVWTHQGRWRRVTHTYYKGWELMYDLVLSTGEVLTCTGSHRVLEVSSGRVGEGLCRGDDSGSDCEEMEDPPDSGIPPCAPCLRAGGLPGNQAEKLREIETGPEESTVWATAAELHRRFQRQQRAHETLCQWCTGLCAPGGDGGRLGAAAAARQPTCAPHRRGRDEQRLGQPGPGNPRGPQPRARLAGPCGPVEVTAVRVRGCCGVFDISVDEDESYLSAGIYSHNSSRPNGQNIPPVVRKHIVAPKGWEFVVVDQANFEGRIMAHFSQDPILLEGFRADKDFHQLTADNMGVDRPTGKTLNLALFYGLYYTSLARRMGCSLSKAKQLYYAFFATYSYVRTYQETAAAVAARKGYVRTIGGRRRYLTPSQRNEAANSPIQGSAGDIMNHALRQLMRRLPNSRAPLCAQIHDEGVWLAREGDGEAVKAIVCEEFEAAGEHFGLRVPLKAEGKVVRCWADMKG